MSASSRALSQGGVTVVVGTFNGAAYLEEQLRSVLRQTVLPTEIVISDDGSTDDTVAIARRFAETASVPVRVVAGGRRGVSRNFLSALEGVNSRWIAWCDQDDVWRPEKLERCIDELERTGAVLAFHGAELVDERLQPLRHRLPQPRGAVLDRFRGARWGCFHGFATVFERSLLDGVDLEELPRSVSHAGEWHHDELVHELARFSGRRVVLHEALALYRRHGVNVSADPTQVTLAARVAASHSRRQYLIHVRQIRDWAERSPRLARDPLVRRYLERLERDEFVRASAWLERTRMRRFAAMLTGVVTGTYRPRVLGGYGVLALAKDVMVLTRTRTHGLAA